MDAKPKEKGRRWREALHLLWRMPALRRGRDGSWLLEGRGHRGVLRVSYQ